ncbi:hypothetical protein [Alkalicoccobacillus porphyridii]|uniref:Uncharacterized protein n=1 Tax=Alkalicoccobacillus porphyridii TaxID=2597270 RepID=A0A553ZZA9_9BACI|nr:hypothetical protein [Alkalicoccobacillus porphyridii]TSB46778.1 hypothetical protein FN960_10570 [Alkalicoccobacillus porphyridii]
MAKKWMIQLGLFFIAVLLGAMFGIQYINERMDISHPAPLEQTAADHIVAPTHPESTRVDLVAKQEQTNEENHNFFSEAAISSASGLENVSRGMLNRLIYAIDVGLNGREE